MPDGDGKGNLEVNLNKAVYHCWSCGGTHNTHGSIGKLITKFGRKEHKKKIVTLYIRNDKGRKDIKHENRFIKK